jgi:hypothetical protein
LKMAELEKPHLILMDVVMPGMDGMEVCRRLRKQPATATVPILLLSFRVSDELRASGFASGCTDLLKKPLAADDLVNALRKHLGAWGWEEPLVRKPIRWVLTILLGAVWIGALFFAHRALLGYDYQAGADAKAPATWPRDTKVRRDVGANGADPTIVVFAHPQCPCTRATIGELAVLMAKVHGKATATVVFVRPDEFPAGWEQTDLWRSAAAIPGVDVLSDPGEVEATRFGAQASGQTMFYDASGVLRFSGGITEFRGHAGDNAGRSAITSLILTGHADVDHTSVYGCSLKNPERAVGEPAARAASAGAAATSR